MKGRQSTAPGSGREARGAPGGAASSPAQELRRDRELTARLHGLLYGMDRSAEGLPEKLRELESRWGPRVYAELIFQLSHLRFGDGEAARHWRRILGHRDALRSRLGSPVDLRVALVSYFIEVDRQLRTPKIIELRLFEETRESAYRDELTGLKNYRFFVDLLEQELLRAEQYGQPLSLVMLDVDDFKRYNDRNGHEAGNRALKTIARLLGDILRRCDVAARYGGEELVAVLPMTPKTGARLVAERVCRSIEDHAFPGGRFQPGGALTASLGVATFPADARRPGELVRRADRALYLAKRQGKNRVELYGGSSRSWHRVPTVLRGVCRTVVGSETVLSTENLSEGGIRFLTDRALPRGALVEVRLDLPGEEAPVGGSARVTSVERGEAGRFQTAARFVELAAPDRYRLRGYLRRAGRRAEAGAGPGAA